MKTPTLEEVKEYFKNAKEVKCLFTEKIYDILKAIILEDNKNQFEAYFEKENDYCRLYKFGNYAEIISYIEPTTKVRNSVLLQLADNNSYSEEILKKECPKLFDKKEIGNRLIEEAKKKGFVKGAMFYEFWIKDRICVVNDIEYTHSSLDLRSDGRCLYHNGQWAEIIETPHRHNNNSWEIRKRRVTKIFR